MNTVVLLTFGDGTVGRMQFAMPDVSDDAVQVAIGKGGFPAGAPTAWRRCTLGDFPADPTFRNAWVDTGKAVSVDMPKAREIHRANLRVIRAPMLAALDVAYQRADERGDMAEKAAVAAKKQALRDVTADPSIDAAMTPEQLKLCSL